MGIVRPPNRMRESNEDHGIDLESVRKMYEGEASVKNLVPTATGKLRVAPTKVEQAMEDAQSKIDQEIAGLAKLIAKTEDYHIKKAVRGCVPSRFWKQCLAEMDRGNTFAMRKLLNEFDIKVSVIDHPDLHESDDKAGITRRHLRVTKGEKIVWEHIWEWSRG